MEIILFIYLTLIFPFHIWLNQRSKRLYGKKCLTAENMGNFISFILWPIAFIFFYYEVKYEHDNKKEENNDQ